MDSLESKTITTDDGITFHIRVLHDYDSQPNDDCYSNEDRARWRRDEWSFVGVCVNIEGFSSSEASLWGVEYGQFDEDSPFLDLDYYIKTPYITSYKDGVAVSPTLVEELMNEARYHAKLERERLNALPL